MRGTTSYANCHLAASGFGDTVRFNTSCAGQQNVRAQLMWLWNVRFCKPSTAFWDRRAASLEDLATEPILDVVTMGYISDMGGIDSLYCRLRTRQYCPELFMLAFTVNMLSNERVRRAFAQHHRSIVSRDRSVNRAACMCRRIEGEICHGCSQRNAELYQRPMACSRRAVFLLLFPGSHALPWH